MEKRDLEPDVRRISRSLSRLERLTKALKTKGDGFTMKVIEKEMDLLLKRTWDLWWKVKKGEKE